MDAPQTPKELITEAAVVASVKTDFGPNAELLSWHVEDFCYTGDNYNSYVTSIQVETMVNGVQSHHSYIAKLNPCRKSECWKCITNSVFTREGYFLHDIAPRLCNILRAYDQHPLRLPVDLYSSCTVGKETLISRDLRENNFEMPDRRSGLDEEHAKLVLQELARLHAASFLLEEQNIGEELQDIYPFLQDEWGDEHHVYYAMFEKFTQNQLKNAMNLLQESGGYNKAISGMEDLSQKVLHILQEQLHNTQNKFKVICHGDVQINNVLFRYDNSNHPVEVMLLDLQRAKVTSLAADLNYFLYTSLDGKTRSAHLTNLLQAYYESFSDVMKAARIPMRFTFAELQEEFVNKNVLGFIYGINAGMMFLEESEGLTSFDADCPLKVEIQNVKLKSLLKNHLYESRVKSLVDEMLDSKIM